ncbi:MAG: ammonia-forming cytochrome c nitrite reductase subunit c552 [Treponema sp.]|jgi:nitrite reductase (cytochrome c-552)|nr:ammonia-forming cytochrome c nitrite reductase subunit c552 [Treponema sp.]
MKQHIWRISVFLIMAILLAMFSSCGESVKPGSLRERSPGSAQVVQMGSKVTVKTASDWASEYPDIYASYQRNANNSENYSYVETYPMLGVVYEGMAFSKFYNSARGHVFTVEDLYATGRPHPLANCFACKTPDFHAVVIEQGVSAYRIPFDEMRENVSEPVSCFNCHAGEPGKVTITHNYLIDALGSDLGSVSTGSIACAQCHVEYHFGPANSATPAAVILPYKGLAQMHPDSQLQYYNSLIMPDGGEFYDYINPRTGVRQIKIQHPEFETFHSIGSQHAGTYACADCHMPTAINSKKVAYASHEWMSPLKNPGLIANECSSCHKDLAADVAKIQEVAHNRSVEIGLALESFTNELAAAIEKGNYRNEQLASIRKAARESQFYWDFVWVENSNGAHNSQLTKQCLDKSEALLNEAKQLLAQL